MSVETIDIYSLEQAGRVFRRQIPVDYDASFPTTLPVARDKFSFNPFNISGEPLSKSEIPVERTARVDIEWRPNAKPSEGEHNLIMNFVLQRDEHMVGWPNAVRFGALNFRAPSAINMVRLLWDATAFGRPDLQLGFYSKASCGASTEKQVLFNERLNTALLRIEHFDRRAGLLAHTMLKQFIAQPDTITDNVSR